MRKTIAPAILCLAAALCAATGADAKVFTVGETGAGVSVDMPDSWKPNEIDSGIQGTSDDGSTYIAVEVIEAGDLDEALKDEGKFFDKEKIMLEPSSEKKQETQMDGLPGLLLNWTGSDPSGPAAISVVLQVVGGKKVMLLTYWGSPDGVAKNGKEIERIIGSLKILK